MDVKVEILRRSAVDQPFSVLSTDTVALTGSKDIFTPAIQPGANGPELRVRVSAVASVVFRTGNYIDPATRPGPTPHYDGNGVQTGMDPAPTPVFSNPYAAWGGQVTQGAPFDGPYASVVVGNPGMDLTA